MKVVVID